MLSRVYWKLLQQKVLHSPNMYIYALLLPYLRIYRSAEKFNPQIYSYLV